MLKSGLTLQLNTLFGSIDSTAACWTRTVVTALSEGTASSLKEAKPITKVHFQEEMRKKNDDT